MKSQRSSTSKRETFAYVQGTRLFKNYHIIGHLKCVLCTETGHFPDSTSEMYTVYRDRTFSRQYIRNVYCAQSRTFSRRYLRNTYSAQRQDTFQTVHQKCVLCTETGRFLHSTSEMCIVHKAEHFTGCTHVPVFTDQESLFSKETRRFRVTHTHQHTFLI